MESSVWWCSKQECTKLFLAYSDFRMQETMQCMHKANWDLVGKPHKYRDGIWWAHYLVEMLNMLNTAHLLHYCFLLLSQNRTYFHTTLQQCSLFPNYYGISCLARSANLPEGLYILLVLISSFLLGGKLAQYLQDQFSWSFHQMEGICVNCLDHVQIFRFLKGRCLGNQFCVVSKTQTTCDFCNFYTIWKRFGCRW